MNISADSRFASWVCLLRCRVVCRFAFYRLQFKSDLHQTSHTDCQTGTDQGRNGLVWGKVDQRSSNMNAKVQKINIARYGIFRNV